MGPELQEQVFWCLIVSGLLGVGALKAFHTAWAVRDRHADTKRRIVVTQQKRYFAVLAGLVISIIALALPAWRAGVGPTATFVKALVEINTLFAWAIVFLFGTAVASPVLAVLVGLRVYLRPSRYAYKEDGRYVTTAHARMGVVD